VQFFEPSEGDVVETIDACGVFDSVTGDARDALIAGFQGVRLVTGEVLMREGDAGDALYLVRHGRLRTRVVDAEGTDREIGQVGKGEVVGEMALITEDRRSATVTAMRDSELYRLPAHAFVSLTAEHPEVLRPFAGVVVQRLRNTLARPQRPSLPATIVLLPTPGADVEEFAHDLAAAITMHTSTVVTSADAQNRPDLAKWLLEIENAVDVSLLIADNEPTAWTRQCLRHADRAMLVACAGERADLTAVERDEACAERLAELPAELIMLYRTRPSSSSWVRRRSGLLKHHNLRAENAEDLHRLVRRLTGHATVLVLGGGGARGFAHLGVIRALAEAGVPVDGVVGTSAGAIIGGGLAFRGDLVEAEATLLEWFDKVRWRRDFNPPSLALTTGSTLTNSFREFFGESQIEDLTVDYAAVSCDLVSAQPWVDDTGPLWRAIRCSASVPGIFPPVAVDDRLLVDGGLVANLPVAIASERHPGDRIIAVDVGDASGIDITGIDGTGITNGWNLRRQRKAAVTLPRVLMRLTELGQNDSGDAADIVIRPDVDGFGVTDTKPARQIIKRGYAAGVAAVEEGRLG
jgi:NTE family protein